MSNDVISVRDFGAIPGREEDASEAWGRAFEEAHRRNRDMPPGGTETTVAIPAGAYRIRDVRVVVG